MNPAPVLLLRLLLVVPLGETIGVQMLQFTANVTSQ
jgi:hypothetical protein